MSKWIDYDARRRSVHVYRLILCVRLCLLNYVSISQRIQNGPLFQSDMVQAHQKKVYARRGLPSPYSRQRNWKFQVAVIAGYMDEIQSAYKYHPCIKKFNPCQIGMGVKEIVDISCDANFYTFQNYCVRFSKLADTGECYDASVDETLPLPPLKVRRSKANIAVLDGFLYVIGGEVDSSSCRHVERFNALRNVWEPVPPIMVARHEFSTAVAKGKIYILGGYQGQVPIASMECYDPETLSWSPCPPLLTPRKREVGVLDDVIYAVEPILLYSAGPDPPQNNVERFDPRIGKWESLAPISFFSSNIVLFSLENILYVVGTFHGLSTGLAVYDCSADTWEMHIVLDEPLLDPVAAILPPWEHELHPTCDGEYCCLLFDKIRMSATI